MTNFRPMWLTCGKSYKHFTPVKYDSRGVIPSKLLILLASGYSGFFICIYGRAAAIAQWFCLCPQSCGPGFKSHAHYPCFIQFILLSFELNYKKNENKQKETGIGPFKKPMVLPDCQACPGQSCKPTEGLEQLN